MDKFLTQQGADNNDAGDTGRQQWKEDRVKGWFVTGLCIQKINKEIDKFN